MNTQLERLAVPRIVPKIVPLKSNLSRAIFSPCRLYRYALFRQWGENRQNACMFIGLNPSTADEIQNDPTVTRCIRYAYSWHFDAMFMMNAYAYRSTGPDALKSVADIIGPQNDDYLRDTQMHATLAVACWGNHIDTERQARIVKLFCYYDLQCLGHNKNGTPKHPLYIAHKTPLRNFVKGETRCRD